MFLRDKEHLSYWIAEAVPLAHSPTLNMSVIVLVAYEFSREGSVRINFSKT